MSLRQARSIRRISVIGVVFIALLVAALVPVTAFAADSGGFDVSFPNCGQTLPTSQAGVVIVGVEGGRSFTKNPCLAEQFQWAGAAGRHFEVYINTSYPAGSTIHRGDNGPKGVCAPDDWACRAYNYGFNNAEFAFHYAQSQYAVADTWWLDVETANSWSDTPALNAQVIRGAVDSLRAHGVLVGIYSIPPMWKEITGDFAINLPKWVVRIYESHPVATYCSTESGFGGGTIALVQIQGQKLDEDFACPGDAFAGQAGYAAFPLTIPQYGELFGTHGGVSTFYVVSSKGAGATQSVTFDFTPSGADLANALFLTVSQDNQELARTRATDTSTPGHLRLTFTPRGSDPIIVRVQSFNYEGTPPISYAIAPS